MTGYIIGSYKWTHYRENITHSCYVYLYEQSHYVCVTDEKVHLILLRTLLRGRDGAGAAAR